MTDIEIAVGPDGTATLTLDGEDISRAVLLEPIEIDPRSLTATVTLAAMRSVTLSDGTLVLRMEPEHCAALVAAGWTPPPDHDDCAAQVLHVDHPAVRALREAADDLAAEWGDAEMVRTGDVLLALRERALREGRGR